MKKPNIFKKIFSKKEKLNLSETIDKCVEMVKEVSPSEEEDSVLFLSTMNVDARAFVFGNPTKIISSLISLCEEQSDFKKILFFVNDYLKEQERESLSSFQKFSKELENKSSIIDLPNNEKGIAIDASNIDEMTEKDIDDILDKIINENKRNSNDGPDKREE